MHIVELVLKALAFIAVYALCFWAIGPLSWVGRLFSRLFKPALYILLMLTVPAVLIAVPPGLAGIGMMVFIIPIFACLIGAIECYC